MNRKDLRHELAFADYVAMGPNRTLPEIARKYTVSLDAVKRWSRNRKWSQRVKKIDERAADNAIAKAEETLEKMNRQHLNMATETQAAFIRRLKAKKGRYLPSASDAVQMAKLERVIRGAPVGEGDDAPPLAGEIPADMVALIEEETRRLAVVSRTRAKII